MFFKYVFGLIVNIYRKFIKKKLNLNKIKSAINAQFEKKNKKKVDGIKYLKNTFFLFFFFVFFKIF